MRYVAKAIVEHRGEFLALHHKDKKECLWRFPGGKVENGETPVEACRRELFEEVGLSALRLDFITCTKSELDGQEWIAYYFAIRDFRGSPRIREPEKFDNMRFMSLANLYAVGSLNAADVIAWRQGLKPRGPGEIFTPYAVNSLQAQILDVIADGGHLLSNEQIGARLGLTREVVDTQRRTIQRHAGVKFTRGSHDRSPLVEWWNRNRFSIVNRPGIQATKEKP